jgi:hypothetical protein
MASDWAIVAAGAIGVTIPSLTTARQARNAAKQARAAARDARETALEDRLAAATAVFEGDTSLGPFQTLKTVLVELPLTSPRARVRQLAAAARSQRRRLVGQLVAR